MVAFDCWIHVDADADDGRFPRGRNLVSVSCPRLVSDKRGLVLFQPQQRHANTWRVVAETVRAPTPQGSRRVATRGWCQADF